MPTCSPVALELSCYLAVRSPAFHAKSLFGALVATALGIILVLPLAITWTMSYGAASTTCYDRFAVLRMAWYGNVDSDLYEPDWDVDDAGSAVYHLFPMHLFNSISTVVSLFGFWVWLFFSPHTSDVAQDMDRTCTETTCVSHAPRPLPPS